MRVMKISTNKTALELKWVYKTKLKSNGEIEKYKARLRAGIGCGL